MRLLAVIEYDGTEFAGFQLQGRRDPPPRTVQQELERALVACSGQAARVIASGRTDTGVHARGQVVHFDTTARLASDPMRLTRAWNAHLAEDVKVRAVREVPNSVHARFSATTRRYCYRIYCGPAQSPLYRRHAQYSRRPLAAPQMDEAASCLVGVHDFVAFASQEENGTTVREVFRTRVSQTWARVPDFWHTSESHSPEAGEDSGRALVPAPAEQLIEIEVEAGGFLRHMMRRIAGTLIRVGDGRLEPAGLAAILASRDKSLAGPTAPARGLCLEEVTYGALTLAGSSAIQPHELSKDAQRIGPN